GSPVSEIAELSPATSAITITKTATTSAIPPPVIAVEIRRTSKLRTLYLSGIAISHPIVLNCARYLCPSASALRSLCHPERSPFLCHPERSLRGRRTPVSTSPPLPRMATSAPAANRARSSDDHSVVG